MSGRVTLPPEYDRFREVWVADAEYVARSGSRPWPVCVAAEELRSGRVVRLWRDEFGAAAPFDVGGDSLFIAYAATAEIGVHLELGWETPIRVLDPYLEYRRITNGRRCPYGAGLLGALTHYGISAMAKADKSEMRDLVIGGGPWDAADRRRILDYCGQDVTALKCLTLAMIDASDIDLDRALLRGRSQVALARIERNGVPMDREGLAHLGKHRDDVRRRLVADVDQSYGVFEGETFREDLFVRYLLREGIAWPRHPSGRLKLDDDTFKARCAAYPELGPLRDLRRSLSVLRKDRLEIGPDGRNRTWLNPFGALTGRNQPPSGAFIFGQAAWRRGFIRPDPGWGLAYLDWDQQEFGIAAALSGDAAMMAAYESGDPYLAFAKQAGAVPEDATKQSHRAERERFKACVLAVQYGMGAASLGEGIGVSEIEAQGLLETHRRTYARFWGWSDDVLETALARGWIETVFGWRYHLPSDPNERTIRNFPMQANGAEMLRTACILGTEAGIEISAPVHDAVLIHAPLERFDEEVAAMKAAMVGASRVVLDGFEIGAGEEVFRYPERFMDERGAAMWDIVQRAVA